MRPGKPPGDLGWQRHDAEDGLFLVVNGRCRTEFRDRYVCSEGRLIAAPCGVECRPVAE